MIYCFACSDTFYTCRRTCLRVQFRFPLAYKVQSHIKTGCNVREKQICKFQKDICTTYGSSRNVIFLWFSSGSEYRHLVTLLCQANYISLHQQKQRLAHTKGGINSASLSSGDKKGWAWRIGINQSTVTLGQPKPTEQRREPRPLEPTQETAPLWRFGAKGPGSDVSEGRTWGPRGDWQVTPRIGQGCLACGTFHSSSKTLAQQGGGGGAGRLFWWVILCCLLPGVSCTNEWRNPLMLKKD